MVFPSSWISQSIAAQNSMFMGMQSYAQQASYGAGLGGPPQHAQMMPPPPPPTLGGVIRGYGGYAGGPTAGAWGESLAGRMAGGAQMGMGLAGAGMAGLGAAGSLGLIGGPLGMAASMMDPMGLAMRAGAGAFGMAGGGFGGLAAGGLAAGAVALPAYAATSWAGALASNFRGGMQDQMALNSTLRQNFNFMGGQGAFGRGFSQQQMGQIGGMVGQEARNNVFTSAGELNQLIAGGAQMGQFTGVRDVQEFGRRFREMITTLRTVQRELGGSLAEAQEFVNQSRQAGVFGSTQATRFAATIRSTSAITGMEQGQLIQLAAQGAQIARTFGGNGRQGAFGAMRGISTVSTMMNNNMIDESMLSEATGGLTGSDAMQAFVGDMMQRTGRFSQRAMGRYSIFGLANRSGTGLDEGALMRFQMGDMGVGELSRSAHGRVGEMGRARAINREGLLRGALMEQGGITGQIGMMRMMVGDRVMDQGDDMISLVMQRRFGMSRPQAEVMTSMMRNQGTIAREEITDRIGSRREEEMRTEVREHRSVDAFMRNLGHSIEEGTGMLRARDMGRDFVTSISSRAERVMNELLGVVDNNMSREARSRMGRLAAGAGGTRDMAMMRLAEEGAPAPRAMRGGDLFNTAMFQTGLSAGERLERVGFDVTGLGSGRRAAELREAGIGMGRVTGIRADGSRIYAGGSEMTAASSRAAMEALTAASSGTVSGRAEELLGGMEGDVAGSRRDILRAMRTARGRGDESQFYSFLRGGTGSDAGLATTAFMARQGMTNPISMSRSDIELAGMGGSGFMDRAGRAMGELFGTADTGMTTVTASEYFAAGGAAASDLRAEAERMRAGRSSSARRRGLTEEQRTTEAQRLEGEAAGISGVSATVMSEVMGRADVRSAAQDLLSDDASVRARAVETLERLESTETDDGARRALSSLSTNARRAASSTDPNARAAFLEVALPAEERAAMRREAERVGSSYTAISGAIRGEGLGAGMLREMFRGAGAAATGGRGSEAMQTVEGTLTNFATMSDEEFQEVMTAGSSAMEGLTSEEDRDRLRAVMMNATAEHGRAREIMGRGRRGERAGREASLARLSGGSLGSMEFSIGGRTVSGRNVAGMMLGGGRHSAELMEQFRTQLGASIGEGAASDVTGVLSRIYSSEGEGGRSVTATEYRELEEVRRRHSDAFERVEREGHERALASASSRDPVGAETNRLLGEINTGIRSMVPADPATPPPTTT